MLFFVEGPQLPIKLELHEMIRIGKDLIVIGGYNYEGAWYRTPWQRFNSLLRLSCRNNICKWNNIPKTMYYRRERFVAIPVPDDFVKCD